MVCATTRASHPWPTSTSVRDLLRTTFMLVGAVNPRVTSSASTHRHLRRCELSS